MSTSRPTIKQGPQERKKAAGTPAPTIWDKIAERAARIPESELAKHPTDGARNLHHYLHGHEKEEAD